MAAAEWPFLRVAQHVDLEVAPPCTGFATLLALVGFLAAVDQQVRPQRAVPLELLPTDVTGERFLLHVDDQVLP